MTVKGVTQQRIDLFAAVAISVCGKDAGERRLADRAGPLRGEGSEVVGDVLAVARDEDFAVGGEEVFDAFPRVGDQAGGGAGRLEHARGGEKPIFAIESRAMLSTASGVQLKALCWWV
jgi:hypothetical protein